MIARFMFFFVACTALSSAGGSGVVEAPYQPDYAKSTPEKGLWREVRDNFMRAEYARILRRHKIRLNCGNCTTVYADFEIAVSLIGRVKIRSVPVAKACGKPMHQKMLSEFTRFLEQYTYKPGLYGTTVLLRLGTGLKC